MDKATQLAEARRIIRTEAEAVHQVAERLDAAFLQAIELLRVARLVALSGVGKSGIIAQKIASTLSSVGTPAIFLHPVEALHGDIGVLSDKDCAIILSRSGTTQELVQLVPFLKQRSIPVIGILGSTNGYLSQVVDVVLDASIEREACPWDVVPSASTTAALALGDALALVLMQVKNFTITDFARSHPMGQLGRNLTLRVVDVMVKGELVPRISPQASLREAIIEISRKGLGCVCVVEGKKLVGIITDGDVRRVLERVEDIRPIKVSDVMTACPITITPDALLGEALAMMERRERQIGVLPVVTAENECIGLVRIHDIIRSTL
ncbi:MAG: KpsF/GutQ family sugar-phosphate isomerase [Bacteroidota bacterium]|nr:KpsF/GutQ family sugar-phosphate isomerase [Candidatus Kapabacteria bacterium]MCX7929932.1 KpsF/GutQ family sugar-phosphate isomerase [Chlorobiota bacterium]MDW8075041.1 KpsF/GutQ family sugar-phosphate isomerase [Bacteroidota bacterium]MDW8271680.1 KpsF/GutQ family sugar-phosphate isomerase [Bacteroidota bacterium]